ncbi:hypothetical protein BJX70DRAFT_185537 [Aspergillus crustosus]
MEMDGICMEVELAPLQHLLARLINDHCSPHFDDHGRLNPHKISIGTLRSRTQPGKIFGRRARLGIACRIRRIPMKIDHDDGVAPPQRDPGSNPLQKHTRFRDRRALGAAGLYLR